MHSHDYGSANGSFARPTAPLGGERRKTVRIALEQPVTITTLNGERSAGLMCEMNNSAVTAYVDAEFELANRVNLRYHIVGTESDIDVDAIVRRRNGFCYVFDVSLAREFDDVLNHCYRERDEGSADD